MSDHAIELMWRLGAVVFLVGFFPLCGAVGWWMQRRTAQKKIYALTNKAFRDFQVRISSGEIVLEHGRQWPGKIHPVIYDPKREA